MAILLATTSLTVSAKETTPVESKPITKKKVLENSLASNNTEEFFFGYIVGNQENQMVALQLTGVGMNGGMVKEN